MTWLTPEIAKIVGPIGAAVVAGALAILWDWLKMKWSQREDQTNSPVDPKQQSSPTQPITVNVVSGNSPRQENITTAQISPITHKEMADAIMAASPFQQDAIEALYIGKRVRWRATLDSVSRFRPDSDGAFLHASTVPGGYALECHAKIDDLECLMHLPKDSEFWLEGTIESVSRHLSSLKDCKASLIDEK